MTLALPRRALCLLPLLGTASAAAQVRLPSSPELKARQLVLPDDSTAPPPAFAAAAMAAVDFLRSEAGEQRRLLLWDRIELLREVYLEISPPIVMPLPNGSAIHLLQVADEQAAVGLSRSLQAEGFLVPAIRYPTVAKGAARLRITVTAAHTGAQIRQLAEALQRLRPAAAVAA